MTNLLTPCCCTKIGESRSKLIALWLHELERIVLDRIGNVHTGVRFFTLCGILVIHLHLTEWFRQHVEHVLGLEYPAFLVAAGGNGASLQIAAHSHFNHALRAKAERAHQTRDSDEEYSTDSEECKEHSVTPEVNLYASLGAMAGLAPYGQTKSSEARLHEESYLPPSICTEC